MKRLITLLSLLVCLAISGQVRAQSITNYAFTASSGSFTALSGGTTMALSGGSVDEGWFNGVPIGFTFVYMGIPYTTVSTSTNGWMTFGQNITNAGITNALATGGARPLVGPLWDDNEIQINTNFSYQTSGSPGSQIFTAEWLNVQWKYNATGNTISFQVKLYEASGVVEFLYRDEGGTVASGSASIGITASATGSGNYLSLNGTGTNPTASSTTETTTLNTKPASGQTYTFTPPATVPNAPTGLNFTGIAGTTMTLNWTDNSSDETGFFIYQSLDDVNYTLVAALAANSTTYPASGLVFGTTYYWQVYAFNEGHISSSLSGSQATLAGTLSGIKTIPGDYATIALAVADLNNSGVLAGGGGVTFNVAGDYTESITSPIIIAAAGSGSASDPVIFQKSGSGANPIITRADEGSITTTTFGAQGDAVIIFDGCDYVTFDQINLAASNSGVEYGYYLRKATPTDGCKNITVKNASITMTKGTSGYVAGIYSSNNDANSSASSATGITLTSTGGRHENVTITGNTIANVFSGIVLRGYSASTPYDLYDQNFTIGASGQGNTIQNYAGNAASAAYGVYIIYHNNPNVSYNILNNTAGGGSNFTSTGYGIFHSTATNASGTYNNNQITLSSNTGLLHGLHFGTSSSNIGDYTCNGNTFSMSMAGTSEVASIYAYGTVNSFTINNNTFSIGTFASTSTSYMIYANTATNNVTVSGNQTTGTITKTGAGAFYCYYNLGSPTGGTETITNNNFSNITATSGSSALYGIYSNTAIAQNRVCSGNTVSNLTHNGTGLIYGIYPTSSTTNQVSGNTVHSLSGGGTLYGLYFTGTNPSVYSNTIYGLTTSGTTLAGIYNAGSGTTNCYNNIVYNLNSTNAAPTVSGILITAGTANYTYNNFISDIKATASGSDNSVRGINITSTTTNSTIGVYYNSIFLNATSSGTNFGSTGVYHTMNVTATTAALDMRNNIIVNVATPNGTGKTVAYRRSGTTLTNYGSASNNNDFYAGTPGSSNLIFYDGANSDLTIDTYKSRVQPRDAASISEDPTFVNEATAPYDLHLDPSTPTQCESGGTPVTTPVNVAIDFDGNDRNGATPDIGADEFDGIGADETAPGIIYALIPKTSSTANQNFNGVEITDISGVNIDPGTNPRLYYKRKTDANIFNDNTNSTDGWKYDETDGATSPFDFSIDYALLNGGTGVTTGDTIQYFVVAQDLAPTPNVGINSGTFNSEQSSVDLQASAFPITGTINYYAIVTSFSGTYAIGAGQTYRCLTADADTGFFKAVNNGAVSGNIIVNVTSDLSETGAVALNQWIEDGAGNYTITIKPNDATLKTISGSYAGGLIRLNGADRVTFDGSFSARSGENYLSIINTATTGTIAAIQLISLGNGLGCANVTVQDCNISCGHNGSSAIGIFAGGATVSTSGTGADNDNLTIASNIISKCYYGISAKGVITTGELEGLVIMNNIIGSETASDYVLSNGISISGLNGASIIGNEIFNMIWDGSKYGIYVGTTVYNSIFSRNKIHTFNQFGTSSSYYSTGIYFSSSTGASNNRIDNNLIYDLWHYGSTSNFYNAGIRIVGGDGYKIYYNSISISGAFGSTSSGCFSHCLMISTTATNTDLRDNIFSNTRTGTSPKSYTVYSVSGTSFSSIDFNDYYTTGAAMGYFGSEIVDLPAWRSATSQDLNSIDFEPQFISSTDLHIPSTSPVIGAGTPVAGIDFDFTNADRDDIDPSMGAYEAGLVISCPFPTALTTTNITNLGADMGWADATGTFWDLYIVTSGEPAPTESSPPTVNDHNATSYTWTGGSGNTDYKWYVRSDCGQNNAGVSLWVESQVFTTLCDPYSSINENFDAITAPIIPNCWAKYTSPSYTYQTIETYTTGPYSSPNSVRLYSSGASAPADAPMLISPFISNIADGTHEVRFFAKGASTNLSVIVGTMSDPANPATFTTLQTVSGLNTSTYTECVVNFSTYSGTDNYIAFKHPMTTTYSYIYIDNVIWQPLPSCPSPTNYTTTNITATTATLDWTNGGSETLWDVIWGPDGFDPLTQGTLISNIDAHPYLLNPPLSGNTNYDWYVRADCAPGDSSLWSAPVSFKTLCELSSVPWTEGFESLVTVGSGIIPDCMVEVGDWSSANNPTTYNRSPHSGTNYIWTNWSANDWLFTPMFELTAGQPYEFSFWYITDGAIPWTVETYFGSSQTSVAMTEAFGSPLINPVNVTYAQYTATLVPTVSGPYCVGIHVISTITPDYISFDDLMLDLSTLCPQPASTSTTNITENSADLNWANWPDSFFDVFFGEAGTEPGDEGTTYSGLTGSPLNVTSLDPNADYNWYIRKDCGFDTPNVDNFWMAMDTPGNLLPLQSGGTADDPGETGTWYLYDQAPGGMDWWNIWFYDDPVDTTRMKKIRMGFWVSSLNGFAPGMMNYVINWSDTAWDGPGFPTPMDEAFIHRSPVNGPLAILPDAAQWIELYYVISDYNPEWVSIDLWGENIIIENIAQAPPVNSPLFSYYDPLTMTGGIIIHECLPKTSSSTWAGPVMFSTAQIAATTPFAETFETLPSEWKIVNGAQPNIWTIGTATAYAGTQSAYISQDNGATNSYNIDTASIVHVYRDIAFTGGLGGYQLEFFWQGVGEGPNWDRLRVYLVETSVSPVSGTELTSGQIGLTNYNLQAAWAGATIDIPGTVTGTTKRLVFSWTNDDNTGAQPPVAIDEVKIGLAPFTWTGAVDNLWSDPGNWNHNLVPDATSKVIIPTDPTSDPNVFPVITGIVSCYSISIGTGAIITVQSPGILNVLNP